MSATLTMLKERLALYLSAEKIVLEGNQSWSSPDGMNYTRANINALQREISAIRQEIAYFEGSGSTAQQFVFGGRG
ncbi:MAG: hypothetical protein VR65_24975 [Desulfobulbaceae bacterium BRH_c16a]|nr:MAG: hypothetical protein VR65_24975 [Desulfobulbaceae bacterium BRH_c16a]